MRTRALILLAMVVFRGFSAPVLADAPDGTSASAQLPTQSYFTLQRWAVKQGGFFSDLLWFPGDFDGDGKQDLAVIWNDAGGISIDVHRSTGSRFVFERWATQQGAFFPGMPWFAGDFNGDGKDDLALVWNDSGGISIDVHRSTGSAFEFERWATQQGAVFDGMLWFPGDFNGDGKQDLAVVWNDGGGISIDVHKSTGSAFVIERWATSQGLFMQGMPWFAGDFDGDGKQDLALVWNGGGIAIDVHRSTGSAFTLERWATSQGSFLAGMLWFPGDFNGDGKDDLAAEFDDGGRSSLDVHASTGTDFVLQRWATRSGDVPSTMRWFVADCNGDGRDDLASPWDDGGMISINVHVAVTKYIVYLPLAAR